MMSTKSPHVLRKVKQLTQVAENVRYIENRNPRNLEKLCIAYKNEGFHLEKKGRKFWNKLLLEKTNKFISAKIVHHQNGVILEANTKEWAIKKQLYKTTDTSAYTNLARVLAQRCHEIGLCQVECFIDCQPGGKVDKFLKTLKENGVELSEPARFEAIRPWHQLRPDKPWEVLDDK